MREAFDKCVDEYVATVCDMIEDCPLGSSDPIDSRSLMTKTVL